MDEIKHVITGDVLIIGSGLAGSMAAISCLEYGQKVIVVNKGKMCWSGSTAVCGGNDIAVCFPEDDSALWLKAFVESSDYTADQNWIEIFLKESYTQLLKLEKLGEKHGLEIFPKQNGAFWRINRAINPFRTVLCNLYSALEAFSKELKASNAVLYERIMITKLLEQEGKITGAIGIHYRTGEVYLFQAKAVVLATGCCTYKADLFDVCGEGYTMAYEIGAKMMSFDRGGAIMRPKDVMRGGLLCSSASSSMANALGSKLVNREGVDIKEHMTEEEKKLGRMGQDRAIQREIEQGRGPVYEDFINLPDTVKTVLSQLRCAAVKRVQLEYGKNPFVETIPMEHVEQTITLDQINRMGGVWIDCTGQTSIEGLFAVGDASCPKISFQHPYNGSDLGWALLSGGRVGKYVAQYCADMTMNSQSDLNDIQVRKEVARYRALLEKKDGVRPDELKEMLIQIMIPYDIRHCNEKAMVQCLDKIHDFIQQDLPRAKAENLHELREALEVYSMAHVAVMIVSSELYRKESRVGVRREDYPFMDNLHWKKWIGFVKHENQMCFFTESIPENLYEIPDEVNTPFVTRL